MKLFINNVKKDIYELKSILKKLEGSLDETEKTTLHNQIEILVLIKDDLEMSGECIIEEN